MNIFLPDAPVTIILLDENNIPLKFSTNLNKDMDIVFTNDKNEFKKMSEGLPFQSEKREFN